MPQTFLLCPQNGCCQGTGPTGKVSQVPIHCPGAGMATPLWAPWGTGIRGGTGTPTGLSTDGGGEDKQDQE